MTETTSVHAPSPQQDDKEAIQRLTEEWSAAMRRRDAASLISMITEDAIFLPPGFPPIRGRQAVQAMYDLFFPQFSNVEQTVSVEELEVAGEWAFIWGTESLVLAPPAGGPPIEMQGKGMSILRRQQNGSWKFSRGINNSLPCTASKKP
jgi:uncharacterized protein (TIGR02246 family)